MTTTEFPVPSRWAQALMTVLAGLSIPRRVDMLLRVCCTDVAVRLPSAEWKFCFPESPGTPPVGAAELIALSLYDDLKREAREVRHPTTPMSAAFGHAVASNPLTAASPAGAALLLGIATRLKKACAVSGPSHFFGRKAAVRSGASSMYAQVAAAVKADDAATEAAKTYAGSSTRVKARYVEPGLHLPTVGPSYEQVFRDTTAANKSMFSKPRHLKRRGIMIGESGLGQVRNAIKGAFKSLFSSRHHGRK